MNFAENDERVHLQRRDALRCQYLMSLSTDLDSRIPMKKKRTREFHGRMMKQKLNGVAKLVAQR